MDRTPAVPEPLGDGPENGQTPPEDTSIAGSSNGLRLAIVPGAQPQRWVRTWRERLPEVPIDLLPVEVAQQEVALSTAADAALVRLPVDRDRFEAIPLYTETTVVVVPKDHLLAAGDELSPADLADEVLLVPWDDVLGLSAPDGVQRPATTADAVELVAAGIGVLLVPQSLARLHHRRDLTYRTVTDEPTSTVALAWARGRGDDLVEELIGIVRGRTVNSSRGRGAREASVTAPGDRSPAAAPRGRGKGTRGTRSGAAGGPASGRRTGGGRGQGPAAGRRGRPSR
ncbi:LysR family substrate-binding domain-containing protein [Actinotalea sp.]|uniref:LysR family substrate-binding domain-containing protein n=1 Tax=Actinotalea sp. TaxID=1872145 RepID=UPI003569F538